MTTFINFDPNFFEPKDPFPFGWRSTALNWYITWKEEDGKLIQTGYDFTKTNSFADATLLTDYGNLEKVAVNWDQRTVSLYYSNRTSPLVANLPQQDATYGTYEIKANASEFTLTDGDDTFIATEETEVDFKIDASGGDDRVDVGAGDDTVDGGAGDDQINGGQGDDDLSGGDGKDTQIGSDGDDLLFTGHGIYLDGEFEIASGGAGNDTIYGGNGKDSVDGGDGDDLIMGVGKATHLIQTSCLGARAMTQSFQGLTAPIIMKARATIWMAALGMMS